MSEINSLFNQLLHFKLIEVFSNGSMMFLLAVFVILLLFCTAYIIIGTISNNKFSKLFLTCWITGRIVLSLFTTFFIGRSFDCISKTGKPIKYEYNTSVTKSVNKSLSKIANKFPYALVLNTSNDDANTRYYIFSNSSSKIKKLNSEFTTDRPNQLIFLKSDNNTVVIKAIFNDDGFLQNYDVSNHIGLSSDEYSAIFTNTNQMKIQDLMQ